MRRIPRRSFSRWYQGGSGRFRLLVGVGVLLVVLFICTLGSIAIIRGVGGIRSTPTSGPTPTDTPTLASFLPTSIPVTPLPTIIAAPVSSPVATSTPSSTPTSPSTATPSVTPGASPTGQPTAQPSSSATSGTSVNSNPWGYNFNSTGGSLVHTPPAGFCNYFPCIANFQESDDPDNGYLVECNDGKFGQSGGETGSCSQDGGDMRPLYAH
ncbi:MAG TPA: hypothetical protein VGD98_18465 [Ktedonobacteraceae bacterium]